MNPREDAEVEEKMLALRIWPPVLLEATELASFAVSSADRLARDEAAEALEMFRRRRDGLFDVGTSSGSSAVTLELRPHVPLSGSSESVILLIEEELACIRSARNVGDPGERY